jgi:chromosome partitioning protein
MRFSCRFGNWPITIALFGTSDSQEKVLWSDKNEADELAAFESVIASFGESIDFLVIDTPAHDSYLMRLAHLAADTLLTPLNDSFLDFGTLASIDPVTHEITDTGHYAAMVAVARQQRRSFDHSHVDWLVIRNRFSLRRLLDDGLDKLAMRLGFRPLDGCAERIVYRELFPTGLTAFDSLNEATLRTRTSRAHLAAQREMGDLYTLLQLPTNDRASPPSGRPRRMVCFTRYAA